MKVLMTGAGGRVGGAVVKAMAEAGYAVRATDRVYSPDLPADEFIVANLLDRERAYALVEGCEAIVHFGNYSNQSQGDPQTVFNENVTMNMNVLHAAAEQGAKKFIFASSVQCISGTRRVSEVGEKPSCMPYLPADGGLAPCPGNAYALSKEAGESQLDFFSRAFGIATVGLRFPHIVTEKYRDYYRKRHYRSIEDLRPTYHADELFSFIFDYDVAGIVVALLRTQWQGRRIFFPASRHTSFGWSPQELIAHFYSDVKLRKPLEQIDALIDPSEITAFCGWSPSEEELVESEVAAR